VVRGNLGWIETGDFDKVPPDLRFFAGGDRSIRGYKYKSISPKERRQADRGLEAGDRLAGISVQRQRKMVGRDVCR
jgi:translocation and assembly module TamA